ncbi:MAG TPA: DUF4388 domain-containing protein [Blastocatellia bacterium]|nr:DUF4388 domain-containing protein [Blastocatellia bacterium]
MTKEKRTAKRISHICEVECLGADVPCLRTRMNDLSTAGAFIDSMTCFAVGSILKLKFRVNGVLIEAMAEVRYCMPQIGMGVRFVEMSQESRSLIESLVEGKPSTGAATEGADAIDQEPGQSSPPASASNVLSGNFAVVSLFDIIHMIDNSRLTGTLRVVLPSTSGEIYFNEGRIAGAMAGLLSGAEALNRLLGATEGSFEFKKSDRMFENTIEAESNTALLLDLLRAKDEEKAVS